MRFSYQHGAASIFMPLQMIDFIESASGQISHRPHGTETFVEL
jgi:hypothetical protein